MKIYLKMLKSVKKKSVKMFKIVWKMSTKFTKKF